MLAAQRVTMTGAKNGTASANHLPALVAGCRVGRAMRSATLGARFDTRRTEASGAALSRAGLEVNVAVVALALRVCAARSAGRATQRVTGATAHLIFCTGDLVATGAARCAIHTERRLVDMAGQRMSGAGGAATRGAQPRADGTDCSL